MSRFDECLKFVLSQEGGYVNHPADPGGATNKGVTQAVYDLYRINRGLGRMPVYGISGEEITDIYRKQYWKPIRGDSLPNGLDLVVFDAAVNHGVKQSSLFLQRALGVDDDGVIGPQTIGAVLSDSAAGMTQKVIADVLDQRRDFYEMLVKKNAKNRVFLNGWMNRVDHLEEEVLPC